MKITTKYGIWQGIRDPQTSVCAFLGIPYATAPVGALRWKPPIQPEISEEVFVASEYGPSCIQPIDEIELASCWKQSEDCLRLNIWTKDIAGQAPVMVFIHGGGFIGGGSADPLYDGLQLAARNEIVSITINYRCNVLGFLDLESIDGDYPDSANLGLLDQLCALKWIQENISLFGGDPGNVTVFGESAGGCSVLDLMTMPIAKGLFHKVICESGNLIPSKNEALQKQIPRDFMEICGAENMGDLLQLSEDDIRVYCKTLMEKYGAVSELMFCPAPDNRILPMNGFQHLKNGSAAGIPLLIGTTKDEFRYWQLYYDGFMDYLETFTREMMQVMDVQLEGNSSIESYLNSFPDMSEPERRLQLINDLFFRINSICAAEAQSAFADTYMYFFTWPSTIDGFGACHAVELPFVFYNLDTPSGNSFTGENPPESLAEQVQKAWVAFAASGSPQHNGIPLWEKYNPKERKTMLIDSKWHQEKDPGREAREILSVMY